MLLRKKSPFSETISYLANMGPKTANANCVIILNGYVGCAICIKDRAKHKSVPVYFFSGKEEKGRGRLQTEEEVKDRDERPKVRAARPLR